jgi:hypothetical protein
MQEELETEDSLPHSNMESSLTCISPQRLYPGI